MHYTQAGDNLVVLEVESTDVCMTGLEEVEHHWKEDKEAALNPCKQLKHVLQRTARDSPDVVFVTLEVGVLHHVHHAKLHQPFGFDPQAATNHTFHCQ